MLEHSSTRENKKSVRLIEHRRTRSRMLLPTFLAAATCTQTYPDYTHTNDPETRTFKTAAKFARSLLVQG